MVSGNSYLGTGSDFRPMTWPDNTCLLGRGRAADIVVNVLLPFVYAWSRLKANPELERKSVELYQQYPKLPINTVERHMITQLGLNINSVNSARRQQGLIHIYRSLCTQGKCSHCPLTKARA